MEKVRKLVVNQRDFVSWENVWLFVKTLVAIEALMYALGHGMPSFKILLVTLVGTWLIYELNKY